MGIRSVRRPTMTTGMVKNHGRASWSWSVQSTFSIAPLVHRPRKPCSSSNAASSWLADVDSSIWSSCGSTGVLSDVSGAVMGVMVSAGFSTTGHCATDCSSVGGDGLDDPPPKGHSEYALLEFKLDGLVATEGRRNLGLRAARLKRRGYKKKHRGFQYPYIIEHELLSISKYEPHWMVELLSPNDRRERIQAYTFREYVELIAVLIILKWFLLFSFLPSFLSSIQEEPGQKAKPHFKGASQPAQTTTQPTPLQPVFKGCHPSFPCVPSLMSHSTRSIPHLPASPLLAFDLASRLSFFSCRSWCASTDVSNKSCILLLSTSLP
ncbi:hypothetical protein PGT21_011652 [Puccinia graminis f. sp. tritici]|uniref:Uncharacterized protein n=1 Tax=Puccinia graminis f. sp. tritici TaxID=56615 RepID=A0A5B0PU23_PUCGR|nr:hypothetical protein PGT21_011652 [Puccinia graminis f. sp. tritici]